MNVCISTVVRYLYKNITLTRVYMYTYKIIIQYIYIYVYIYICINIYFMYDATKVKKPTNLTWEIHPRR